MNPMRVGGNGPLARWEWRDDDGSLHREDGPAIEFDYGGYEWWVHGRCYRPGGGPAIEHSNYRSWNMHGPFHRDGGPAVENRDGSLWWYKMGKRHRLDGPAVENPNGDNEYWVDGIQYDYVGCRFIDLEGSEELPSGGKK